MYKLDIYGLNDTNITISATSLSGQINLIVKRCKYTNDPEDCEISSELAQNPQ